MARILLLFWGIVGTHEFHTPHCLAADERCLECNDSLCTDEVESIGHSGLMQFPFLIPLRWDFITFVHLIFWSGPLLK